MSRSLPAAGLLRASDRFAALPELVQQYLSTHDPHDMAPLPNPLCSRTKSYYPTSIDVHFVDDGDTTMQLAWSLCCNVKKLSKTRNNLKRRYGVVSDSAVGDDLFEGDHREYEEARDEDEAQIVRSSTTRTLMLPGNIQSLDAFLEDDALQSAASKQRRGFDESSASSSQYSNGDGIDSLIVYRARRK